MNRTLVFREDIVRPLCEKCEKSAYAQTFDQNWVSHFLCREHLDEFNANKGTGKTVSVIDESQAYGSDCPKGVCET